MIVIDTSALIASLSGAATAAARLRAFLADGERIAVPTLVLYEWWRGPRTTQELRAQEALLPSEEALSFGQTEAAAAARLYGVVTKPRSREIDLAIAACALVRDAKLWTLNMGDFADVPGLMLVT